MSTDLAVRQAEHGGAAESAASKRCSIADCSVAVNARGMCKRHYDAWRRSRTPRVDMSPAARFERKFVRGAPGECWEWAGDRNGNGYGLFRQAGVKRVVASVHALAVATGGRPAGAFALHHCDNPPCVNPGHLYWGSQQDNMHDMVIRNRQPKGTRNGASVLTDDRVLELRERFSAGETALSIAKSLGVSKNTVLLAAAHSTWKHVGGPSRPARRKNNDPDLGRRK